ncbi:hypothetical protein FIM66_04240 [Helicobacter pylori]|uniref:hypothetical protein n=1 Tax=Helicobacter pylori TaxID=210 RepID=UPI000EB282B3|nr:hypothetical protein [Helicobacter pylori]TPH29552.1 hypothetical protein FIM86_03840 [Helicobacter pylori]TPH45686.1 hypothetical protein FIM75_03950 [Helicobacter pylori]TPH47854.1 hypothetical protein FIM77_05095 [Helicobacter pylori]TPH59969.1 hypothetical protein FIM64_01460 [Helicobacter pylori]TPH61541.1 hypothetical protein FIM66_04240 [Helicobacter pylori]
MPKDNNKELTLFERVWGSEIKILPTLPRKQTLDSNYQRMILIKSNELYYAIGNAMNQDGRVYYKTSVSPDKLMRYTSNGQYSSMLKGEKGFGSHIGFEIANNIAIETMNHIAPILNYKLAEIYYEAYAETNRLFNENQSLLTQQNIFVTQQINALKAKTKFLQEVYKDISQTSKSDVFRQSTCTSLQRIRIELDEIFYNFISQINQGLILKNFNDVSGNYICARYALSHYGFALVLEYVVAGLIDNESMKFLKAKVEEAFDSFNQTTKNLGRKLNSIQDDNCQSQQSIIPFYGWYYGSARYHPNQLNEINRLNNENADIEYIKSNILSYFDIKRDSDALFNLIEAPKQYLQNIVITHEEE